MQLLKRLGLPAGQAALVCLVAAAFLLPDGTVPASRVLTFLAWAAAILAVAAGRRLPLVTTAWPYLLWAAAVAAAAVWSPSEAAAVECVRQLVLLALVFAVPRLLATPRALGAVLVAFVVSASIVLVQAVGESLQATTATRLVVYRTVPQWSGYPELGVIACMAGAVAMAVVSAGSPLAFRLAGAFLAVAFAGATVLLNSRFAWLTIAAVCAWMAVASFLRWRRVAPLLFVGLLMGAIVVAVVLSPRLSRLAVSALDREGREVTTRLQGWSVAMSMIADRPLLGVGPGNYTAAYPTYSQGKDRVHAYNITLHVAAETGAVGLAALLIMWGRALVVSFRSAVPGTPGVLSFALHGLLLAFFVRSLGEHFLANLAASYRFLVLLGIVFGMVEATTQNRRDAHAAGSSALPGT